MFFKQLKYFIAIVESKSFTDAADKFEVSQSAISQQINALEQELDVKLISREGRKFSLTPAGEYFYHEGKVIVERAEALKQETIRIGKDDELTLKIGYLDYYDNKILQDTIFEFAELYPEVILSFEKLSHEELFSRISNNELDLVLSYQRRAFSNDYENFQLKNVPLCLEVSSKNHLAKESSVDVSQIANEICIINATAEQRRVEEEFYKNVLCVSKNFQFASSVDNARLMVIANRGVFPVPEILPASTGSIIKRLPVYKNGQQINLNFCAFWKNNRSNYYIEEFATMLRDKLNKADL